MKTNEREQMIQTQIHAVTEILFLTMDPKTYTREKKSTSTNSSVKTGYPLVKD
jgi:hypothetical protein